MVGQDTPGDAQANGGVEHDVVLILGAGSGVGYHAVRVPTSNQVVCHRHERAVEDHGAGLVIRQQFACCPNGRACLREHRVRPCAPSEKQTTCTWQPASVSAAIVAPHSKTSSSGWARSTSTRPSPPRPRTPSGSEAARAVQVDIVSTEATSRNRGVLPTAVALPSVQKTAGLSVSVRGASVEGRGPILQQREGRRLRGV